MSVGTTQSTLPSDATSILVADFLAARDDQRFVDQIIVGIMGVIGILIPIFAAIVDKTCADGSHTPGCTSHVWGPAYAAFPLIFVTLFAYLTMLGTLSTVRSYYIRDLEMKLNERLHDGAPPQTIHFPGVVHLGTMITSQRRGFAKYRLLFSLIYFTVAVLGIGIIIDCLAHVRPTEFRYLAVAFYVFAIGLICWAAFDASIGGQRLWFKLMKRLPEERERTNKRLEGEASKSQTEGEHSKRSLSMYLLLPRPTELLVKSLFLVFSFFLVHFIYPPEHHAYGTLVIGYIAFEFFVYQGRYIFNDLRGISSDASYSRFKAQTRFPVEAETQDHAIFVGLVAAFTRIAIGVAIGVQWLQGNARWAFVAAVLATLVLGTIYDGLRDLRNESTPLFRMNVAKGAILSMVGVGYAIRVLLGWSLAVPLHLLPVPMILVGTSFFIFGSMFVSMSYAIGGLHLLGKTQGPLPPHSKLTVCQSDPLAHYPHYGPLMRQVVQASTSRFGWLKRPDMPTMRLHEEEKGPPLIPLNFEFREWLEDSGRRRGDFSNLDMTNPTERGAAAYGWHVLRSVTNPWAWPNVTYVLSAALAGGAGITIGATGHVKLYWLIAALTAALALSSVIIVRLPLGVLAAPLVTLTCYSALHDLRLAVFAAVPVLAVTVTYEVFRNMSLAGVEVDVIDQLRAGTVKCQAGLLFIIQVVAGEGSKEALIRSRALRGSDAKSASIASRPVEAEARCVH